MYFRLSDLQRELNALDVIAKSFLAHNSKDVLGGLALSLERIHKGHASSAWEIAEDAPLETVVSKGGYQDGGHGAHEIYAQITMAWDVRPVDDQLIEVHDRSSTRVVLVSDDVLGVLSMDIGDQGAPGCFFHVQVQNGGGHGAFPASLDVPRFPTLVATPASVVEFVLSELFQKDWSRHAAAHAQRGVWISSQKHWWRRHLTWQSAQIEGAGFSPWVELKESVPGADLFC
jgi:hypothetical protein